MVHARANVLIWRGGVYKHCKYKNIRNGKEKKKKREREVVNLLVESCDIAEDDIFQQL